MSDEPRPTPPLPHDGAESGRVTKGVITATDGVQRVLASRDGASVTVHNPDSTTGRGSCLAELAVGDVVTVAGTRDDPVTT